MIHDSRDPKTSATYLAARGVVTEVDGSTYLLLEQGSMQRQQVGARESAIIAFERYVFDLDQFEQGSGVIQYKPRERRTWELLTLDRKDPFVRSIYGRFRAELHDRLTNPLYPLATLAIAFAALGNARTTRQGRGTAIAGAVAALVLMRIAGFAAASLAVRSQAGVWLMYLVPILATLAGSIYATGPSGQSSGGNGHCWRASASGSSAACRSVRGRQHDWLDAWILFRPALCRGDDDRVRHGVRADLHAGFSSS